MDTMANERFRDLVEDALRNLPSYPYLGEHPLAGLGIVDSYMVHNGSPVTYLDKGRALREAILTALNELKPAGERSVVKEWHPYIILYDEYVEGKKTAEIMSELFMSEGTVYRARRESIEAVARVLMEMEVEAREGNSSE